MLGSNLLGQRVGFDSRRCPEMQCCAGPCLREGGGACRTRPIAPAWASTVPHIRFCYKDTAAPGGGGFFVFAKQASRKERTQKRHKTIRSKVSAPQLSHCACPGSCPLLARTDHGRMPQVEGRPDRPRLAVYRSNNHIYAQVRLRGMCLRLQSAGQCSADVPCPCWPGQVIDDYVGHTLVAASTLTPEIRAKLNGSGGADKVRVERCNNSRTVCKGQHRRESDHGCCSVLTLAVVFAPGRGAVGRAAHSGALPGKGYQRCII